MPAFKTLLAACALTLALTVSASASEQPPITPVAHVDLSRFMGQWYVIATIPTRFEKNAYNAVENYVLQPNGHVETSFHFRPGAFDAPVKSIHSTAFVTPDSGNAVWGVQVFWPIKAQYIVAYLKDDYSQVIVARDARDYTWVMARTPTVSAADYAALVARVKQLGYSLDDLRKVPQAWPAVASKERTGATGSTVRPESSTKLRTGVAQRSRRSGTAARPPTLPFSHREKVARSDG